MKREDIKDYVDLLKKWHNNKLYNSDKEQIEKFQIFYEKDEQWRKLIEKLKVTAESEYDKTIEEFLAEEKIEHIESKQTEEEKIAAAYGIDVSDVERIQLSSGKIVFKFYSQNINEYVLLENDEKNNSLEEQLKEMQKQSVKFQQYSDVINTNVMLENERINDNNNLEMFPFSELNSHPERLNGLSIKQIKNLQELAIKKDELGLTFINFENGIAMTDDGKVYESMYDEEKSKSVVVEKNSVNEKNKEISDMKKDPSYSEDLEKTLILNKENINKSNSEIDPNKAQLYYDYPELLQSLSEEERTLYENNNNSLNDEKQQTIEKPKIKIFKIDPNSKGFASTFLLSLTTGFFAGMLTTMVIQILRIKSM